ncbi:hypothetical protein [Luteitalea pratensis]|uniref:hypothetical protein n=1 Tax=Luteitalea pratensis TaxID=1855912 RepID=UPI0012FFA0FE|nr:hypothetical protein [Luteitalea pratensis]
MAIPPLLALLWMPLDTPVDQAFAVAGFGFCAVGAMTNQIIPGALQLRLPHPMTGL